MNWGKSIVLAFILFAVLVGALVAISMRQDVNLVSKNYYQEELIYQDQITRLTNTADLSVKPRISATPAEVTIVFPYLKNIESGSLRLFRPSNQALDQQIELLPNSDDAVRYPVQQLVKGLYRAQMTWTMDGKEYYYETIINI